MTREAYEFLEQVGASNDPALRIYSADATPVFRHPVLKRAAEAGACRDLRPFYELRPARPLETYEAMARLLIRRALSGHYRLVCLSMGNPLFWTTPTLLLRRACARAQVTVRVLTSPSFIDEALLHMDTTCGEGLVIGLAPGVLQDQPPLAPKSSVLLGQLTDSGGVLETRYVGQGGPALAELQQRLLQVYPRDHEVVLIFSGDPNASMATRRIRIDELTQHEDVGICSNVWIPPLREYAP
jgi:uncharacterized protein YabN with tetrapyrrole methylase and pyrophosphatase domain